ncbi:MAG: DUF2336 domain-containing protein [Alphaproteobacteria bacterium]
MKPQQSIDMNSGVLTLSEDDVNRLLRDTTSDTRIDMTDRIAGAYSQTALSQHENMIAEQIFRLLLRDTEVRVRIALAEHVKSSTVIPHDIIKKMAKDVEEVALPLLQHSQVLTDDDLVELINASNESSRHVAICKRSKVSVVVSDTLLGKGGDEVVLALADNEGAEISEAGVGKIIESHRDNNALMQRLVNRQNLPVAAVNKLINAVSSTLADTLKKKYNISADHIDQEVEKAREKETLQVIRHARTPDDVMKIITQLRSFNRLSPSIILSALCQGNFEFFETSLAVLAKLPVENARALINDRGELGFRAIYNKSGLPDAMFPAVNMLLKVVHQLNEEGEQVGSSHYANRIVERILQQAEDSQMGNLSYIIALVRRVAQ